MTDKQKFIVFSKNSKEYDLPRILTAHRFVSKVIDGKEEAHKCAIIIRILMAFAPGMKEYVFKRIKKEILLELALCLIQDLAANVSDGERTHIFLTLVKSS